MAAVLPPDPAAPPVSPRARRAASLAIGATLLLQIAIPAAYFLAPSPGDERFRWRMFSTRQYEQPSCTVAIHERDTAGDGAPRRVDLHGVLSAASVRALLQFPERVGEALLRARCSAGTGAARVELRRVCHRDGAGSVPAGAMTLDCGTGALSREGWAP
jgi:hypothetical protein